MIPAALFRHAALAYFGRPPTPCEREGLIDVSIAWGSLIATALAAGIWKTCT